MLEVSLPMLLKYFNNRQLWDNLLVELLNRLQKGKKTFYRISDEREAHAYASYPRASHILENGVLTITYPYSEELFDDLFSSVWSYDGILKIFCCTDHVTIESYTSNCLFTIAPYNDGESIEIGYSSDEIAEQLIEKIVAVIQSFGLATETEM